ncbi:MAG TPA: YggS family pyridoxal phosphate-dependent enzyme [Bacillus sp. (in: firmicutes)]|uniref:YggS family pyridoxal phosphate-dependent enzyme n=1 Tax=Bacillus litorisediminis TaxID=2922713 RepID=UPI001FAE2063|nr:YggS family pyridoxal phosphate-dependent enzyme [Bacillus litorisediminis]HWO77875.1 YggS family pyridoxal phosphate-dependent enzyme [Bacillus sp. (in: firmicutes)]
MSVKERYEVIKSRIKHACDKAGRSANEVHIIAVTKYVSIDRAKEALEAGVMHLGENRDDGFLEKWNALGDKPTWHFIGTLQSRKVKQIIDYVDFIHSLDRLSLAKEINKRAQKEIKCFVQVNASGEASKHGLAPEEAIEFIHQLQSLTNIKVVGLMTMAPLTEDTKLIRNCFRKLKDIQKSIQSLNLSYAPCTELSMGMSNDYEIAVEEGATFVRIGTALVGNENSEVEK